MEHSALYTVLGLLVAAIAAVLIAQRLRLGSVLGFLAAGAIVGPWGLALIDDVHAVQQIAEFGVVFLLFVIGMELKPSRLVRMRRMVFGLGSLQFLLTTLALLPLAMLAGLKLGAAVLVSSALALSSTAFVLQLLAERGELATHHGRTAFSVLLLQDLAVVPILALVPLLAGQAQSVGTGIGLAILESAAIVFAVILFGRYLLAPLMRMVAATGYAEVFAAAALLLVLGSAVAMAHAGLSMAMGAFIAGLLFADSEFRHQVMADIQPFRGFLLGLFFMSVGMGIDFGRFASDAHTILLWLVVLLAVKAAVLWPLCRAFGVASRDSQAVALLLAQSGEFAFVLFGVSQQHQLLSDDVYQRLISVVALSMAVTPLLARLAQGRLNRPQPSERAVTPREPAPQAEAGPIVLIAGFGRVGRRIARLLQDAGQEYVAVERNAERVAAARAEGYEVFFGDASRRDVLKAAGLDRARVALVTLDNAEAAEKAVAGLRAHAPGLPIHARAHDRERCSQLLGLGASATVSETLEASLQLGAGALQVLGRADKEVQQLLLAFRENYFGRAARPESGDGPHCVADPESK